MVITLRNRPTCHYCGKRNGPTNNQRKFTCQYCEAENYLDESGQVTDVPASATATPKQYALPLPSAFEPTEGSIFCSTCQKNQYMYNTALSEYLPDPDHPEYEKFEDAIPAFKKDLERRFPTCCATCEPKVKAQLQQATYNARSDHLRRVLGRSRQRRNANRWGWRLLLVNTAGLGWTISLLLQLLWHGLGSQTDGQSRALNIRPTECLMQWPVPSQCPDAFEWMVGPALLLGISCLWWNPRWQHKLEGREGRLTKLDQFYKVQAALLMIRFASWIIIKDVPNVARFRPAMHTVSLVLIAMVATWSRFSIIEVYLPQIVDWSQNPAPLLDRQQYIPPSTNHIPSPPNSQEQIPVNIFDTSRTPTVQSWRPPTPPIDEDVMEWAPTPVTFSPALKEIKYKSTDPTPFQGTLPAFPRGDIYQTKLEAAKEQPKAIGLPIGFFDKSHGKSLETKRVSSTSTTGLAQPKFFPDIARADTGLENIFDKVFSLQDEAAIPTSNPSASEGGRERSLTDQMLPNEVSRTFDLPINVGRMYNLVMAGVLAIFTTLFSAQCYLNLPLLALISTSDMVNLLTMIPVLDIGTHVGLRLLSRPPTFDVAKVVVLLFETIGMFTLNRVQPEEQSLLRPLWNKLVIASLALLLLQQIYSFCVHEVRPVIEISAHITKPQHQEVYQPVQQEVQQEIITPVKPNAQRPIAQTEYQRLKRFSSDESLASTASIATTSTAPGWKTPSRSHREELNSGFSSNSYGMGGLSLKNDHGFGTGSGIAGARDRRPARSGQRGW